MKLPYLVLGLLASIVLTANAPGQAGPTSRPAAKPLYDKTGPTVGEQIPAINGFDIDGKPQDLEYNYTPQLTLLLTSSFTCPKSRSTYPGAAGIEKRYHDTVKVTVLYVLEAHPYHDVCPYEGFEDVTDQNLREHILRRQPRTLPERLALATEFSTRLGAEKYYICIDAMDNGGWKSLGGGPNMAFLINSEGIVLARQGWFDPPKMEQQIAAIVKTLPPWQHGLVASTEPDIRTGVNSWDVIDLFTTSADLAKATAALNAQPDLISAVRDYDGRTTYGDQTLLQMAAQAGPVEIVDLLLKRGANVNFQNEHGATALHFAATRGDVPIINRLLAGGARVDEREDLGDSMLAGPTPLQEALANGHMDAARRLIDAGANSNFFVKAGLGDIAGMTEDLRPDPTRADRPDGKWRTPIFYAVANGQAEAAKFLVQHGARLDGTGGGQTVLCWAIRQRRPDMAILLLDLGADPNAGEYFVLPLSLAVDCDEADAVRALLKHGAKIGALDVDGESPLHGAAVLGETDMIDLLMKAGADIGQQTGVNSMPCGPGESDLDTPLHLAIKSSQVAAVKRLIAWHAPLDKTLMPPAIQPC